MKDSGGHSLDLKLAERKGYTCRVCGRMNEALEFEKTGALYFRPGCMHMIVEFMAGYFNKQKIDPFEGFLTVAEEIEKHDSKDDWNGMEENLKPGD